MNLCHCRLFLPASYINTVNVRIFLCKNGINCNGGLSNLAVTDDKLTLTPANRCHGVDSLQSRIAGFMNTLTGDNTRRNHFNPAGLLCVYWALSIQRLAHGRYDPAENRFTNRNLGDLAGPLDHISFLDMDIFAHNGATHIVFFKVQNKAKDTAGKFYKLKCHGFFQPIYTCNAISYGQNNTCFTQFNLLVIIRNLFLNNLTYFFGF